MISSDYIICMDSTVQKHSIRLYSMPKNFTSSQKKLKGNKNQSSSSELPSTGQGRIQSAPYMTSSQRNLTLAAPKSNRQITDEGKLEQHVTGVVTTKPESLSGEFKGTSQIQQKKILKRKLAGRVFTLNNYAFCHFD